MAQPRSIKIPPQNTEAEQALLGSIMIKSDMLNEVSDFISDSTFYSDKHKTI